VYTTMGIKKFSNQERLFLVLIIIVFILGMANLGKATGWLIPKNPDLQVVDGSIKLKSMSVEQKVAQMLVVQGDVNSMQAWKNMQVGGLHLFGRKSSTVFKNTTTDFQYDQDVPFFFTVDLEGCVNPFGYFRNFTSASEVDNLGEAFEKGFREGEFLKDLGINLNFAPVVDLDDQIWKCRAFPGDEQQISELAQSYIVGLQDSGVIATIKHYPGKTLVVQDPHKFVVTAVIEEKDLYPYNYLLERHTVKAVMVSHLISSGAIETNGVPAVVNEEIIASLKKDYEGLIISDEIHMLGLKNFYGTLDEMYIAVYKAGNDVVLNFDRDPNEIHRMIQVVSKAVRDGVISEDQIDKSVRKILEAKGLIVK
jgi:beta-N-acetylhexosaminidase